MPRPMRIEPKEALEKTQDGAILVCAYADREKCGNYRVGGAIALQELEQREEDLARDRELIFYCN